MSLPAHAQSKTANGAAARIASFVDGFSLEATRPGASDVEELRHAAAPGTFVYLSALPRRPLDDVLSYARALRAAGFEPVPHLAARHVTSGAELSDLVARLVTECGVRRLLVIAGDQPLATGPFTNALDVIESGVLQRHGIVAIGISGYPEGHPRIGDDALDRALATKITSAEESGLKVHIVTQFGFDAQAILHWLERLRDLGFDQPVRIGMAGPTDLATLLRFARRCGVRAAATGAARQAGLLKHLFGISAPDDIVRTLASADDLGDVKAHFFSFGGLGASARWAAAVAQGRIALDRAEGFSVSPP